MLTISVKPHRGSLKADSAEPQKVFLMLKLLPEASVAALKPVSSCVLVIDTSGSMYEKTNGVSKLDQAIQAAHRLIDDPRFTSRDQIGLVRFDTEASALMPLTPLAYRQDLHRAVEDLRQFSGKTYMAAGLDVGLRQFASLPLDASKRVFLLTDGAAADARDCGRVAGGYAMANVPVIAIGVGTDYNESLLAEISSITNGRPYHLRDMADFSLILDQEVGVSAREVLTDLRASLSLVKGVTLDSVSRVYPALAEVDISSAPYRLGNIQAGDFSVFVLALTVAGIPRPPSRARIAQVGITAHAPALGRWEESAPQSVFVEFTPDSAAVAHVEEEVVGYVQQMNLDGMVRQAMEQSTVDLGKASQTLRLAIGMTQRLGNGGATRLLESALQELDSGGVISPETRKTVALGMKTKTIKTGSAGDSGALPDDERIRRMTGA